MIIPNLMQRYTKLLDYKLIIGKKVEKSSNSFIPQSCL